MIVTPNTKYNINTADIGSFEALKKSVTFSDLKENLRKLNNYILPYNSYLLLNTPKWKLYNMNERFRIVSDVVEKDYNEYFKSLDLTKTMEINAAASYSGNKPISFKIEGVMSYVDDWRDLLFKTCEYLYIKDKSIFISLVNSGKYKGASRKYLAFNSEGMIHPREIRGSGVYIETKHDANSKVNS